MPLFSIVIPTFNRAHTIGNTLKSVYAQSFRDFEVIVVDDGSVDNTSEAVQQYIQENHLTYLFKENGGVATARNTGASKASGDYLIFLDSDDTVSDTWLQDYAHVLESARHDLIYCSIRRLYPDGRVQLTDASNPFGNGKEIGNVIPGSFCVVKGLFEKVGGYDAALAYSENTELGFRLKNETASTAVVNNANLIYHVSDNGHASNWQNRQHAMLYILDKHQSLFSRNLPLKKRYLTIAGVASMQVGQILVARQCFLKAWKLSITDYQSCLRYIAAHSQWLAGKIWRLAN